MKFKVTWTEERTGTIESEDIKAAERVMVEAMARSGTPPFAKLLSIYRIDPTQPVTPPPQPPSAA